MTDSDDKKKTEPGEYSPAGSGAEPGNDVRRPSTVIRRGTGGLSKASDSGLREVPAEAFNVKTEIASPKTPSSYTPVSPEYPPAPFVVQGNLTWNEDALTAIAQHAIDRTDGIGVVSKQPTGVLSRFFTRTKSDTPQLQLKSMTAKTVTFDVDVWVRYGNPITEVCDKLTASVDADLERLAGLSGIVNIRVRGVV